ncbi:MAG: WD40 repeat domain-containing protein, partial [Planctomycetes bacterium]|nr:WD40 repeat domain-containing protein [Planctomycetota bacterium]
PTTASLSAALVLTLLIATVTGSLVAVRESALRRLAEQRGRTSRAYLYLAEIKLAHQAWKDGEIARVEEILHTHRPDKGGEDLRGWEWYYLLSLCHRSLFTLEEASAMALSPDGRQLAVGNWQGPGLKPTLSIYDLETGQAVASMHGHTKSIWSVAWSPDGKRIASGGNDQTVKVWDRSTNEIICTLAGHENSVHALAWNPAGTRIASGSRDGTIRIWDVAKQEEIVRLEHGGGFVDSVAWRPDGQLIVSASPMEGLKMWNVETWTEASQDASLRGIANSVSPYCVAWDADGKRLAVAGLGQDGQPVAIVWDRETKQHLRLHGHRREVLSVAWSHDGAKLATGSFDKTVRIWDAATGQQLMILRGQTGRVDHVAWLPNGRRVVAEGDGVKVWSVTHSQEATTLPMTVLRAHGGRNDISWNANSNEVAAVDAKDNVSIWDISGRLQWSLAGASGPVAWSPDGRHIAVTAQSHGEQGIQQIDVWSASTRKIVAKLNGHRGAVRNLCWSPDGSRLASTSLGWRFIHNGEEVFNVESDRVIRIWDVQAGEEALSIDPGTSDYVDCIAWSPSGREICWGRGERVGIVDAATGRSIRRFSVGNHPKAVAWSPTGDRIVVCFTFNNALGTFDTATGEKRREFKGHTDQVNAVSWNRDGRRIASTSEDGTIRVWDATTGREVFTFAQSTFKRTASGAVQWSPDGQRLTAWQDGTVKIFDASIGFVLEHTVR